MSLRIFLGPNHIKQAWTGTLPLSLWFSLSFFLFAFARSANFAARFSEREFCKCPREAVFFDEEKASGDTWFGPSFFGWPGPTASEMPNG